MTAADNYVAQVLEMLPRNETMRTQIGMELRSHITERMAEGKSLDDVIRQLGDPAALADSYLSAVPLEAPSIGQRVAAKLMDVGIVLVASAPLVALRSWQVPGPPNWILVCVLLALCCVVFLWLGTMVGEYVYGKTPGKHLFGLTVVRESGRRIGFGQSFVRQLPFILQVIWVDGFFALFTERRQRAFELLSKTRVVREFREGL